MPYKNKEDLIERNKRYYLKNKDKFLKEAKKYRKENKEKIKLTLKKYYEKNKKIIRKKQKKYAEKNRDKLLAYYKEVNQRPDRKESRKKWRYKKLKTDSTYRLLNNLRRRVLLAIKGKNKSKSTIKLIGCSMEELWKHLEKKFQPGMTRENHGKWHVDHIRPCASFDLTDPKQQKKCFHYTNLQPLWALDNIRKGDKYEGATI
jgi:hypothetical protein